MRTSSRSKSRDGDAIGSGCHRSAVVGTFSARASGILGSGSGPGRGSRNGPQCRPPRHRGGLPPSVGDVHGAARANPGSPVVRFSARRRALLRYLVEETLAGRADRLKGFSVALAVFGRDESFDPQADPVVRFEARRLRRDLEATMSTPAAATRFASPFPRAATSRISSGRTARPRAPPSAPSPSYRRWMRPPRPGRTRAVPRRPSPPTGRPADASAIGCGRCSSPWRSSPRLRRSPGSCGPGCFPPRMQRGPSVIVLPFAASSAGRGRPLPRRGDDAGAHRPADALSRPPAVLGAGELLREPGNRSARARPQARLGLRGAGEHPLRKLRASMSAPC